MLPGKLPHFSHRTDIGKFRMLLLTQTLVQEFSHLFKNGIVYSSVLLHFFSSILWLLFGYQRPSLRWSFCFLGDAMPVLQVTPPWPHPYPKSLHFALERALKDNSWGWNWIFRNWIRSHKLMPPLFLFLTGSWCYDSLICGKKNSSPNFSLATDSKQGILLSQVHHTKLNFYFQGIYSVMD